MDWEPEDEETGDGGWGLLTGWRRIAQDVMKDLETDASGSYGSEPDTRPGVNEDVCAVHSNRLKSVIAKSGENFYSDYQMLDEIGSGAFGRALKAKRRSDQEVVVVKELIGRRMTAKEILEAKNEVKVLAHLNHPNIVRYYDFYSDSGKMHIVMEYCEEGDLSSYLKHRNGVLLEENEIMMKFVQICLALHHTHGQGILHRDLKSQNIFLTAQGILKLGDFGISRIMDGEQAMARSMVGTPYYLSPEICQDMPYGPKSDVWSLGCVLYELCMLKHAFDGQSLPALILKILSGTVPEIPPKYSTHLGSLVKRLLSKNPDQRPGILEILSFDYVRSHLQHYGAHIHFSVVRRKDSFQRALEPFDLKTPAAAPELKLSHHRTSTNAFADSILRKGSHLLGSEKQELDHWGEIDPTDDDDAFEISPYRFYTRGDELDGLGHKHRSTQPETTPIPESPLAVEFGENIARIAEFRQRVYKTSSRLQHSALIPETQSRAPEEAEIEEYLSDEDGRNEELPSGLSSGDEDVFLNTDSERGSDRVTNVVAQIRDIMKTPSTQIEFPLVDGNDALPSLTLTTDDTL